MKRSTSTAYILLLSATVFSGASLPAIAQPLYTYTLLPEPPDTMASEPLGVSYHETGAAGPKTYMVGGRTIDAAGISHAVVWTEANDGTWGVELLPVADPNADSQNWSVDSFFDITYDIDWSVGSTGNAATPGGEQPVIWSCTGDPCTWVAETVNLPAGLGFTGGSARMVVRFNPGSTLAVKVCGVLSDPSGGTKAVVWAPDAAGIWQPTLLPGLLEPDPGSLANSMTAPDSLGGTQGSWSIVGAATDSTGHQVPARWACDPSLDDCSLTASWTTVALPMLGGATQGEARAMNKAQLIEAIASNQDVGGGGTTVQRGGVYICDLGSGDDCTLPSSWTVVELPPLPGYANCQAFGIKEDGVNIAASGYSDNGPGTEIATEWIVYRTASPPTVTVFDLNGFVVNLPSDMVLTKKGEVKDVIKITILSNKGRQARNATTFVGDAVVLTELANVPAVNGWGLVAMALLTLLAGTAVLRQRRRTTARVADLP